MYKTRAPRFINDFFFFLPRFPATSVRNKYRPRAIIAAGTTRTVNGEGREPRTVLHATIAKRASGRVVSNRIAAAGVRSGNYRPVAGVGCGRRDNLESTRTFVSGGTGVKI